MREFSCDLFFVVAGDVVNGDDVVASVGDVCAAGAGGSVVVVAVGGSVGSIGNIGRFDVGVGGFHVGGFGVSSS